MRTTGEPVSTSIPNIPGVWSIMFIEAFTKMRLLEMTAVDGSPSIPDVMSGVLPPPPPPPQARAVVRSSDRRAGRPVDRRRFIEFDLRPSGDGRQSLLCELSVADPVLVFRATSKEIEMSLVT